MKLQDIDVIVESLKKEMINHKLGSKEYKHYQKKINKLYTDAYSNLTAWDRVYIARHPDRPKAKDIINSLFKDFIEFHGDRYFSDDKSLIGGIAYFNDKPVTVIAQCKGNSLEENMKNNFGMTSPEGYRKAIRLAKQAEKFSRPIINIVDTPGAYPGVSAEERGQGEAIAYLLREFFNIKTPIITIVLSEGGSGGALALSICDKIIMLENAVYSILSPEGFATILWKDSSKAEEASEVMGLTSKDLYDKKIVDVIINEGIGGFNYNYDTIISSLKKEIRNQLDIIRKDNNYLNNRYLKYRSIGVCNEWIC